MSGGAGSAYMAEISALQTYQKQILTTLDGLVVAQAALQVSEAVSGSFGGAGANNGLGTFDEAVQLSNTYNTVMQTMMTNFKEITELVTAMANALGKSASSYLETEQKITDSFTQIVQRYETQSGGFSTPGSPTSTSASTTSGTTGTSNAYYTATPNTPNTTTQSSTTTTTTNTSSGTTTGSGSGTIAQGNEANASNNTSSEE